MAVSDEEMLSNSENEDDIELVSAVGKGKGKAKELETEKQKVEGPPVALPGAVHGHDLDNLPWSAWKFFAVLAIT